MLLSDYLRSRIRRGFSIFNMGPNEARLLWDLLVGYVASLCTAGFFIIFLKQPIEWWFALAPLALLGLNAAFGIYSKLKMASGRLKGVLLSASTICICGLLILLTKNYTGVVLWLMLVWPALVIPRLFLALNRSKHKNMVISINKERGPILVTGGAGYIGTNLVDLLLKNGEPVRVLDKLMYGNEPLADFKGNRNFEFIEGDVTDVSKLTIAMQGASAVVHLAGLVGDPACAVDTNFTRQMNIISTHMAKDVALSMGIRHFIFASSCSVYGVSDKEVREGDTLNPVSLYAQTKIDCENELLASTRDDFFVTVLRFATVFGHSRRARFDLVGNLFTAQAMNDGLITVIGPQQWRPFVHVRDLARAIFITLKANPLAVQNQIFNVGDKRLNMTILQLAEWVKTVVEKEGKKVNISINEQDIQDRRNYAVSFDKITKVLGFHSVTLMEEGIHEMVENFKNNRYTHYRENIYSNVAVTKQAVNEFYDPMQAMKLYAPLKT
jgi:nucleoside-diphosphate-sugar epimerase